MSLPLLLQKLGRGLRGRIHLCFGRLWLLTGARDRARRQFLEVLQHSGQNFRAYLYLGRIALEEGNLARATREMTAARRASPRLFARLKDSLLARLGSHTGGLRSGQSATCEERPRQLCARDGSQTGDRGTGDRGTTDSEHGFWMSAQDQPPKRREDLAGPELREPGELDEPLAELREENESSPDALWFDLEEFLDDDLLEDGWSEGPELGKSNRGGSSGNNGAEEHAPERPVDPFDSEATELFMSMEEPFDPELVFPDADLEDPDSDGSFEPESPEESDLDPSLWGNLEQEEDLRSPLDLFYEELSRERGETDPLFEADPTRDSRAKQETHEEPPAAEFRDGSERERFRQLPPIRMSEVRGLDWEELSSRLLHDGDQ